MRGGIDEALSKNCKISGESMNDNEEKITVASLETQDPESTFRADLQALGKASEEALRFSLPNISEITTSISSMMESWKEKFIEVYKPILEIKAFVETLQQFASTISEAVASFSIPTISEERKQELLANHRLWGTFGWTWFMDEPMNFYDDAPLSMEDANAKVKALCSTQGVNKIFDDLHKRKIKKEDLESAIYCYRNRQYKACSLMLFGLIDAKLIREQPKSKKEWRKVGKNAVKYLQEHSEEAQKITLYSMLHFANLIACLETFFERGDDFSQEPTTINRNFITHGMNRRSVRQRDCIQLFLLLNNLTYVLERDNRLSK